jgi:predicted flap endonuclease-1-like 5' DNA nuclease
MSKDLLGLDGRIGRDDWIGQATALARATQH